MKKFLIMLLALVLLCSALVACDGGDDTTVDPSSDTTDTSVDGTGGDDTGSNDTDNQGGNETQEPDGTGTLAVGEDDNDSFGPVNK